MHTTAQTSREYGTFRQKLLLDFGKIVADNNAELALPTQVCLIPCSDHAHWTAEFSTNLHFKISKPEAQLRYLPAKSYRKGELLLILAQLLLFVAWAYNSMAIIGLGVISDRQWYSRALSYSMVQFSGLWCVHVCNLSHGHAIEFWSRSLALCLNCVVLGVLLHLKQSVCLNLHLHTD